MAKSVKALQVSTLCLALVLALSFALALGLSGCGGGSTATTASITTVAGMTTTTAGLSADAAALVGKWYSTRVKETLEFTSDGKLIWTKANGQSETFPFSVESGVIKFTQPNAPEANSLPFTLTGNSLVTMDPKYGRLTYTKE